MRLFFGLPIPQDLRDRLTELQENLKASLPPSGFRWTRAELFHVTLAFLGEVPETSVPQLCAMAADLCARHPVSALAFTRFGSFPSAKNPRVLWVGCQEDDPAVKDLSQLGTELSEQCARLGDSKPDNKVVLHVTLARSSRRASPETAKQVQSLYDSVSLETLPQAPITEAILYHSTLGEGPTRYQPIGRFPLNA